ncbi:hypothetical protein NQ315_015263 [Exocentrus adspersus]|uniref:C2H2-type domain-containing protein n=1 Tax=Exocentrus adspersus TaxID=1586481 RepID=A0AAV8VBF8_9CUCU|nr:hypothetical protein NQ315_015263 [Exocentrus adspersus]
MIIKPVVIVTTAMDTTCRVCRICYKRIRRGHLEEINESTRDVLGVLLINLNMDISKKPMMCSNCSNQISVLFKFKAACLYTEDFITPFVGPLKPNRTSLKEIYIKERDLKEIVDILRDKNLCRLCMEAVDAKCLCLDTTDSRVNLVKDMIDRCIPEVNLMTTKHEVVCDSCINSLKDYCNFMDACLEAEKKIEEYLRVNQTCRNTKINLSAVLECNGGSGLRRYTCKFCDYQPKWKSALKIHMLKHQNPSEIKWYKCDLCNCRCKHKGNLKRHFMLKHTDPSERVWHNCDSCDYRSLREDSLNTHLLNHINPLVVEWYKCGSCDYQSPNKHYLKNHMLVHKNASEITWYKCDSCHLQFKRKGTLKTHMLQHKNPSTWFKCDLCNYESKDSVGLDRHMVRHKKPSEIIWYKCELCDHQSKRKGDLKKHMLKHKNLPERGIV